jgi:hypothetical protein
MQNNRNALHQLHPQETAKRNRNGPTKKDMHANYILQKTHIENSGPYKRTTHPRKTASIRHPNYNTNKQFKGKGIHATSIFKKIKQVSTHEHYGQL